MEKLRIGIVGAGAIAQRNAHEAARSGAAQIMGVFDINHKVAREMAKSLEASFYGSFEEMLDKSKIEAVLISTPHFLHKSQAITAANAQKHVIIEKPLANNLEEAHEIIDACATNGVKLTVNYSFRYLPKIQTAKSIIDAGGVGEISGIQIISHQYKDPGYWYGGKSNSPDDWRASRHKAGGGLLIMTTCHPIDYVYYITGQKAVRVYSEYDTLNSSAEVEDIISVTFRTGNNAVGCHMASTISRGIGQDEERIIGTKGTLLINGKGLTFYSTRPVLGKRPGKVHHIKKFPNISWTAEWIKNFTSSVRINSTPDISYSDTWHNLAFICSAYRSLVLKAPVVVPTLPESISEL